MINQIYLSVLFRAKSVKENIYKSLLTLSTLAQAHSPAGAAQQHNSTRRSTLELTIKHKQNSCQEQQTATTSEDSRPEQVERPGPGADAGCWMLERSQKQTSSATRNNTDKNKNANNYKGQMLRVGVEEWRCFNAQ